MRVGDLVQITRGTTSIPNGTLAVVVRANNEGCDDSIRPAYIRRAGDWRLYGLRLTDHAITRVVRFRGHSLELISESR